MTSLYYLVGYRAWLIGKTRGYMTQPELYGKRWDSNAVSVIFFLLPVLLSGFALAGILAAPTSSIDAMFLALNTMLTCDIFAKYLPRSFAGKEVATGRIFIICHRSRTKLTH